MSDVINLLRQLVACRSITPDDGGSLDLISALLEKRGFDVLRLPCEKVDNLWAQKGARAKLMFAGHVDVVPPGDETQWQTPPFTPTEKDGYLHGRGATDMKSGVAAMVDAACKTAADGVGIFLTSDEEGLSIHGAKHFTDWWQKEQRQKFDFGVIGEPTCEEQFGDAIKTGRRGSLTGRVRVNGAQQHAAYAGKGPNAAHGLIAALREMEKQWQKGAQLQREGKPATTFQIVDLRAGVGADNVTPPFATAVFNFRHLQSDSAETLRAGCEAALEQAAPARWQCDWEQGAVPYQMPTDTELAQTMAAIVEDKTGVRPAFTSSGGSSDGRYLREICAQMLEFGVCNATIHEPNERVKTADVETLSAIYQTAIRRLLG